jgi:hypothetical protein
MTNKIQDAYEDWAEDWKPVSKTQHHPSSYEGFEAGWNAAIEAMLERLELSKQ